MELAQRATNISPSPTLAVDARAKEMRARGVEVLNFSAGEPDFDTPEHIKEAAVAALKAGMTKYTPVDGIPALKRAIIEKLERDNGLRYTPQEIVVSAGAKHSLYNAFQVLCDEGDEVILPAPYWVSYLEQIKLAGAVPRIVMTREENGFKLTPEELEESITPRTRVLVLNTPSNPTGAVYTASELAALGEVALRHGLVVISDEIYEKMVYDGTNHVSIASLAPELRASTVVVNGVSKAYSMTGWRIGYAAAPAEIARAMTALQSHATSNPTSIAQAAAVAALTGPQDALEAMVREFDRRRRYMLEALGELPGVRCVPPAGAFYAFPNVKGLLGRTYRGRPIASATDLAQLLLEEVQVAVVPGVAFGTDEYLRLSYATDLERIREGMARLAAFVKELR